MVLSVCDNLEGILAAESVFPLGAADRFTRSVDYRNSEDLPSFPRSVRGRSYLRARNYFKTVLYSEEDTINVQVCFMSFRDLRLRNVRCRSNPLTPNAHAKESVAG